MRVLHISSGNLYGGVEKILTTLARNRHLCQEMEPEFALCFEGRLSRELRQTGSPVHMVGEVRTRHPWTVLNGRRRLRHILEERRIDVAICHMSWTQAIFGPAVRKARKPSVCYIHGHTTGSHWLERWAQMNQPDFVICVSRDTSEASAKMFRERPRTVVYSPLPETASLHGTPSCFDKAAIVNEVGGSPDDVIILHVSRMEACKGHDVLVRALGILRDKPGWTCWIVGAPQRAAEEQYVRRVRELARNEGVEHRIRFTGHRTDVLRLMRAADIYCQPNTGPEGFSIVFMEAFLSALPIVTSGIGGALEIVDNSCGRLVAAGDTVALAATLSRLIDDQELRRSLGAAGHHRVLLMCDTRGQLRTLHNVLASVAAPV
jgi:glycosyltransferase involved in cell wall biosynthesis